MEQQFLGLALTDFTLNSPVCGYVAKSIRQYVQTKQPENVKVRWGFGNRTFSDRTLGRF